MARRILVVCGTCEKGFPKARGASYCSDECREVARREVKARARKAWRAAHPEQWRAERRRWQARRAPDRQKRVGPPLDAAESKRRERRRRRAVKAAAPLGTPYTRESILLEHGPACYLCTGPIDLSASVPEALSLALDHVLPLRLGGVDGAENILPTHFICNSRKGGALLLSAPCFDPIGIT